MVDDYHRARDLNHYHTKLAQHYLYHQMQKQINLYHQMQKQMQGFHGIGNVQAGRPTPPRTPIQELFIEMYGEKKPKPFVGFKYAAASASASGGASGFGYTPSTLGKKYEPGCLSIMDPYT